MRQKGILTLQIQTIYRVELKSDDFEAGHESSDVKFVHWDDIPWDDLAFTTVQWGLAHAKEMKDTTNPIVQEMIKIVTDDGEDLKGALVADATVRVCDGAT